MTPPRTPPGTAGCRTLADRAADWCHMPPSKSPAGGRRAVAARVGAAALRRMPLQTRGDAPTPAPAEVSSGRRARGEGPTRETPGRGGPEAGAGAAGEGRRSDSGAAPRRRLERLPGPPLGEGANVWGQGERRGSPEAVVETEERATEGPDELKAALQRGGTACRWLPESSRGEVEVPNVLSAAPWRAGTARVPVAAPAADSDGARSICAAAPVAFGMPPR